MLAEPAGRSPRSRRQGGRGARRSARAALLQPDRDPQDGIPHIFREEALGRGRARRQAAAERTTRGPAAPADRRDRPGRRARPRRRDLGAKPDDGEGAGSRRSSPSPTSASTSAPAGQVDREARKRGNSVYFPDRVVPMLPEDALSADVCSLKEGADRAAMACHLAIDRQAGSRTGASPARWFASPKVIAYEDAQAAIDGGRIEVSSATCAMPDITSPMLDLLGPRWESCALNARARGARPARARAARAPRGARRAGPHRRDRRRERLDAHRRGRGFHDRRQRRRGQGARKQGARRWSTASTSRRRARSWSR